MPPPAAGDDPRSLLPKLLSPSRALDFRQCPALFAYKVLDRLPSPGSFETTMGTLVHRVLELLFDAPRGDRTPEYALALIEPSWAELTGAADRPEPDRSAEPERWREWRSAVEYREIVGAEREADLLAAAASAVTGYFSMENPQAFDPHARELEVSASVSGVPMRGIIDRLDRFDVDGGDLWLISDYKAGRRPDPAFESKAFFGMKVYALLAAEELGIDVAQLRLIYTTPRPQEPERGGGTPEAVRVCDVTGELLDETRRVLVALWVSMLACASSGVWPATPSRLCDWCEHAPVCPAFSDTPLVPGSTAVTIRSAA